MNTAFFSTASPEYDGTLQQALVQPTVLAALLNAESTLLAAPKGYGKSTLAWIAQQQMRHSWLNVSLPEFLTDDNDVLKVLLEWITQAMWQFIEEHPGSLAKLETRAVAVRYFLDHFIAIDTEYMLTSLADDAPEGKAIITAFLAVPPKVIFSSTASDAQRLAILCDCVQKLGLNGVIIWLELTQEAAQLSYSLWQLLQDLFDSLHLMRKRTLHVKCLALPSVCDKLHTLRGIETLSVNRLTLRWQQEQLVGLVDQRLHLLNHPQLCSLADLIDPQEFAAFLSDFSDVASPLEWLTLTRLLVKEVEKSDEIPLSTRSWVAVRRAYCAERVPLWLDEQGSFWRGAQLLTELTPRKRAIYPLVKYLYEHPGFHRPYLLIDKLASMRKDQKDQDALGETNLNTMISRARAILEPFPSAENETDDGWIYLVTDPDGKGYALRRGLNS